MSGRSGVDLAARVVHGDSNEERGERSIDDATEATV